ncbi:triphosphoribosyl-dephospho-CoA synthase [bacterium]|nr:triphosphoribosyl-dephospho-CoA synthase [bacterium]
MTPASFQGDLTPGGIATLACLLEVSAPKPGNVHRGADFADTSFYDFQTSAVILGQTIDRCLDRPIGEMILECVRANQRHVGKNTNLGMVLLLCPLAKSIRFDDSNSCRLDQELTGRALSELDRQDCSDVYQAIGLAAPGGLGKSETMDVAQAAPECLIGAMRASEDRDWVARQYSRNFETIFDHVIPMIVESQKTINTHEAIVVAHVQTMAKFADSLIARKCGEPTALRSQQLAQKCLEQLDSKPDFWAAVRELDFWLRSDGNRRNPGTTADLIAAALFTLIANGKLKQ